MSQLAGFEIQTKVRSFPLGHKTPWDFFGLVILLKNDFKKAPIGERHCPLQVDRLQGKNGTLENPQRHLGTGLLTTPSPEKMT